MASQDYLIAIALIEQNLVRAMPLGGKEVKDNLEDPENFKKLGEEVVLNLLLRVFQRSDEGALKRASELTQDHSICVNLSGRGDKDAMEVARIMGVEGLPEMTVG